MEGEWRQETQKAKDSKRAWGQLFRFVRPYMPWIIVSFVLATASVILLLEGPNLIGRMAEQIQIYMFGNMMGLNVPLDYAYIVAVGIMLVIIYGTMFAIDYIQMLIMTLVTQRIAKRLRRSLSHKINKLPFSYYDKTNTGDVLSRISNDVDNVSQTMQAAFTNLIPSIVMIIGAAYHMFRLNWIMALGAIISAIIGFVIMGVIVGKSQKYFDAQQKSLGAMNGHVEEYFTNHIVTKTSNARRGVTKRFDELSNDLYKSAYKSEFFGGLLMPLMMFISQLAFVTICIIGGVMAFDDPLIVATIIVPFLIYIRLFTSPLGEIASSAQQLQGTAAAAERVFEFLGEEELENEDHLIPNTKACGEIQFEKVIFGYKKDEPVIKGFTAKIKPGSKVAIVGPTGAGKTTIVNLLMKFYKIDSGDIRIGENSINDLRRSDVSRMFGMVLQDTWIFEGTVRENLVYNMQNITDDQLEAVTEAVGINHFIKTLPKGFDTVLNEQTSISQGQRQLLTIARAMLKDAPLLILDEATSSVDTRTEQQIQKAMDTLTKGRTSFVIAHRLSTIKNADIILVVKDGDIVESGKHAELLKTKGHYAELYNSQFNQPLNVIDA